MSPSVQWISVIAPCRNERAHIDAFCDSVLAQALPAGWAMELLVADGLSDDGTRERLRERAAQDSRILLIDNPGRIVSTGLNACIQKARGTVIARMDIHTTFAPDYLACCLAALQNTQADNVGGPWVATGSSRTARAIAAAFQCRWVVGGARSRDVGYRGPVDSVYLGCWPRTSLDRFGGFDENLVRNQDDEHNLRIRLGGGTVWQDPSIRSTYHPRNSLRQLFAQQQQYGYWRPAVLRKHGQPGSWRQVVPAIFIAAAFIALLLTPWSVAPLTGLLLAYAAYLTLAATAAVRPRAQWGLWPRLLPVIAAYQIGYGWGTWQGVVDGFRQRSRAEHFSGLTR